MKILLLQLLCRCPACCVYQREPLMPVHLVLQEGVAVFLRKSCTGTEQDRCSSWCSQVSSLLLFISELSSRVLHRCVDSGAKIQVWDQTVTFARPTRVLGKNFRSKCRSTTFFSPCSFSTSSWGKNFPWTTVYSRSAFWLSNTLTLSSPPPPLPHSMRSTILTWVFRTTYTGW